MKRVHIRVLNCLIYKSWPVSIRIFICTKSFVFLMICVTTMLQTEAELLAEKRCVAHLIGEVDTLVYLLVSIHMSSSSHALPLFYRRASLSVIYLRTPCFLGRCNANRTASYLRSKSSDEATTMSRMKRHTEFI